MKNQGYRQWLFSLLLFGIAMTFYRVQAAPTTGFPTSRTPVTWPFAWDSIWNLPLGAGAVYVPVSIRPGDYGLYAEEDLLILAPTAPLVDVIAHDADWDPARKRCDSIVSPTQRLYTGVPIPATFSTEPNHTGDTPNHSAAILMPDGVTIRQTQPLHRCGVGGAVVSQYNYPDANLKTGDGIDGAHGGSAMSSMGGTIRLGELQPNQTIRHALKLLLDAAQYGYYRADDPTPGYRWPARWADAGAESYYNGPEPALEMGALLALKPDFAVANLRTEPAKIIARALRDYGGYWVDNAAWNAYYFAVEWSPDGRVLDEFEATWGFPFISPQPANCTNTADPACQWSKDMGDIFTNLHVVDNNSPQTIGGPGVRRQPCAPPFSDGSGTAPTDCAHSGNQPSTPAPDRTPTATVTALPTTAPTATATPTRTPICGNGIIEVAEACDDNNNTNGDGCTDQCVIEQSCYDPGNAFSFFTWSDSYGSAGDGGVMRLFTDAVNRTLYPNRLLPRFWVAAGDVPYVPGIEQFSIEALNGEISGDNYPFTCAVGNRTFPMFVAMGNHDLDGDATQIAAKFAYWRDQIGPQVDQTLVGIQNFRLGPDNGYDARLTYSFDYKNAHFVVVNQYYGDPTYPDYTTKNPLACIRPTMYEWLDQDLASTTRPIKFVFGHAQAWSYCSNAPGYNGCINFGNNFTEDLLDPNERPRPYSPARQAWLEAYGRHWSDSLENAACPAINGQEGRSAFWAMLARHKVTAHLIGHTHTYGSRLVDADGPRNDPAVSQAERNRRAYGKNGDTFRNTDGVWEVDSGMTHNSAGSAYVLVTVRDNRVTFEAWDQMGAGENEEPFRLVETWQVEVAGATSPTRTVTSDVFLPFVIQ